MRTVSDTNSSRGRKRNAIDLLLTGGKEAESNERLSNLWERKERKSHGEKEYFSRGPEHGKGGRNVPMGREEE